MQVLVDSSVWIDFFRGGGNSAKLKFFLKENVVVTNELILTELIPRLRMTNHRKLIRLLDEIKKIELKMDWAEISDLQYKCLRKGINGVCIPDLIIAQNALQNDCDIYTLDQHFNLMKKTLKLRLID